MDYYNKPVAEGKFGIDRGEYGKPLTEDEQYVLSCVKEAQLEILYEDVSSSATIIVPTDREVKDLTRLINDIRGNRPDLSVEELTYEAADLCNHTHAGSWESLLGDGYTKSSLVNVCDLDRSEGR